MINAEQLFKYLKEKNPKFTKTTKRGQALFTCPKEATHKFLSTSPTMTTVPGSDKFYCLACGFKGTAYDLIRIVEQKPNLTDEEVITFISDNLKIDNYPELEEYKKYGWQLFVIAKNSKVPLKDEHWREKEFCFGDKSKWISWLEQGYNLAVNCEFSNVMIVDFDDKEVTPEAMILRDELKKLLEDNKTLVQNSARGGKHYVFNYDAELCFKQKVNLGGGLAIDTRTHKGYFLIAPSTFEGKSYHWVNLGTEIKTISPELKAKLLEIIKVDIDRKGKEDLSSATKKAIENPIELSKNNLDGCCNDSFVRFGGVLIKMGLSPDIVKGILFYLNKNWLRNPMPTSAIDGMIGSLEGYKGTEEQTQEKAIYDACELIQCDIGAADILAHVFPGDKHKRAIVDKYLAKFHKEGKLSRRGRGKYDLRQKVEWTNENQEKLSEIKYKIPYFDDVAYFRNGDIILIGAPTGKGKTTLAMNFVKQMKEQGIVPYYLSLEAGSRHEKVAAALGLTQKDYYIPKEQVTNPLQIEIEENSFSIIDWVYLGDDFAQTQAVFKHLNDEMVRKNGILVVFTQLKEDFGWFAPNLIKSFPRFATRFVYDDETGIVSHFDVCKITDPKGHYQTAIISTEFNFDTKELKKKNNT